MSKTQLFNVVFTGHVDHGKSSLLGRLLADSGMITSKNLETIKKQSAAANAKFSYAFLIDRLYGERKKEKTIDTARCLLRTKKISYQLIDVPGHTEYIKNMLSGATRSHLAILVVDATAGLKENSRRHGFLLSFLGFKKCIVCINKIDLVDYQEKVYRQIEQGVSGFLEKINIQPEYIIPVSAANGDNIKNNSRKMPWYKGPALLKALAYSAKGMKSKTNIFRFPIQDIYQKKYLAGRVESGAIKNRDEVIFFPSQKSARLKTIEIFNKPPLKKISAGSSVAFTLQSKIFIKPGEIMVKKNENNYPKLSKQIKANVFWIAGKPLSQNKKYLMKLATNKVTVKIKKIFSVMDIFSMRVTQNKFIEKYKVGECLLETSQPIAFDKFSFIANTGRFVLFEHKEIAGGGIII